MKHLALIISLCSMFAMSAQAFVSPQEALAGRWQYVIGPCLGGDGDPYACDEQREIENMLVDRGCTYGGANTLASRENRVLADHGQIASNVAWMCPNHSGIMTLVIPW